MGGAGLWVEPPLGGVRSGLPVEAVVQPLADGAEVRGVGHHGAVEGVVPQVHRQRKGLRHVWRGQHGNTHISKHVNKVTC